MTPHFEVDAPSRWWHWGWFGNNNGDSHVTLTLPSELNDGSLNADLELNAGRLTATGDFQQLAVELNAAKPEWTAPPEHLTLR